jgi:hypothetical protein
VNLWTVGCADPRLPAPARSPMDKPGKTRCVSPALPTGRRLPTSFTAPELRDLRRLAAFMVPPALNTACRARMTRQSSRTSSVRSAAQADLYRERCAAYGRQPGAIVLRRDIYVGESSSEARSRKDLPPV